MAAADVEALSQVAVDLCHPYRQNAGAVGRDVVVVDRRDDASEVADEIDFVCSSANGRSEDLCGAALGCQQNCVMGDDSFAAHQAWTVHASAVAAVDQPCPEFAAAMVVPVVQLGEALVMDHSCELETGGAMEMDQSRALAEVVVREVLMMDAAKPSAILVDVAAADKLDEVIVAGAGALVVQGPCAVVVASLVADQVYAAYYVGSRDPVMDASLAAHLGSSFGRPLANNQAECSSYSAEAAVARVVPGNSYYIPSYYGLF